MPERFDVTGDVWIEALGPDEAEHPLVYLIFEDHPETQSIPIFAKEIRTLIQKLQDAAVWLANQVINDNKTN
jgi:hypothetical protein